MLRREKTVVVPEFQVLLREQGLDNVEGVYRHATGDVVTQSGTTEVRRVTLDSILDTPIIFIKKYWVTRPAQLWSGMLRGTFFGRSKVRSEFANLLQLREWRLDAPEPIAYGEERKGGWLVRSFLISRSVPNPKPLHVFIRDALADRATGESRCVRRELVDKLAAYTLRLHEHQFVHHDFFWRNILLSGDSLDHFFLIDAHKGRKWLPWKERRSRAEDLAALDAPAPRFFRRAERLRFFLLYRKHRRLDQDDKALLRLVLQLAEPMREKQLRRVLSLGRLR